MIPSTFPVKLDTPRAGLAHCADPRALPIVDAAFAKPGGPAAQAMKEQICPRCPIGEACLLWAMERGEDGIWGGTGPNVRTRRGSRKAADRRKIGRV